MIFCTLPHVYFVLIVPMESGKMLFRDYVNFVLVLLFCIIIVVVDNDVLSLLVVVIFVITLLLIGEV